MKRATFDLSLALIAAAGGSCAAISGFLSVGYEKAHIELERRPAIHLSCEPEFRAVDLRSQVAPPKETFLLTESGGRWIHLGAQLEEPFARCTVKNYGHLAVLNVRIPLELEFAGSGKVTADLDVPGLSPAGEYEFSLMNGVPRKLHFLFRREVRLTRIDRDDPSTEKLYVDERVSDMERKSAASAVTLSSAVAPGVPGGKTVRIKYFEYSPGELRVPVGTTVTFFNDDEETHTVSARDRSFGSGPLDPGASWKHVFARPGRYGFACGYHGYMRGSVVVAAR